jgi:hypothetical protein
MNSEAKNSNDYELAKGKVKGLITFRNNCGVLPDRNGRPVYYGVAGPKKGVKSMGGSDFIGWQSIVVTPDMVGQKIAVFTAHELKADDSKNCSVTIAAQENFLSRVVADGGRAGFIKCFDDVVKIANGQGCTKLKEYTK